jgi:hypothetical protein
MLKDKIGNTAGIIWDHLNSRGETTVAKLKTELHEKEDILHLALGWLARENKIVLEKEKKGTKIRLV